MRAHFAIIFGLFLASCGVGGFNTGDIKQVSGQLGEDPERARAVFMEVATRVEPAARAQCRAVRDDQNCDFRLLVDRNRRALPNAFQSVDTEGQPVLTFTASMIATISNPDELAFVMAHEAAHHILYHLDKQKEASEIGAEIFAERVAEAGGSNSDIRRAQQLGAEVGARVYSQDFELEADELGTIITIKAGFDPRVGARYFNRLPEPSDGFLSTHPPNEARQDLVNQTAQRFGY